ncbi:unnamed protein product [Polarella glacialis]|uniref:Uncharacterized protein n=1 Tax=Polarella glacialis TaxID=89957 RepID=A0A813IZY1_POLGL|nr:unnamed protein product [Polarella glacialis]
MASPCQASDGIDGQWSLGNIHGNRLDFLGVEEDSNHTLIGRSHTTLKMSSENENMSSEVEYLTAEVKADGKLHWSDGDIWIRRQVTPTSSSANADLAKAKSVACPISPPDWIHSKLNRMREVFERKLKGDQEVFMDKYGADDLAKEIGLGWLDPDIDDPSRLVERAVAQYRLGHDPHRTSDTMPIYKVSFHLLRHPHTGIFHSSNAVKIAINLFGALDDEGQNLELLAELIGGNLLGDRVPEQECCLRLRLWSSRKHLSDISVASVLWPANGCMVDANGKQVPVENWANEYSLGHAIFGRDTTDVDTSVQDRMDAIELPEDVDRAWAHGGILPGELHQAWQDSCSAFTLPPGRCPPNFPGRCFSLPSWGPYQQAYFAVLCIRRWVHASTTLPESSVHLILACLFDTYSEESYCFHGVLAVAAGVRQSREERKMKRRARATHNKAHHHRSAATCRDVDENRQTDDEDSEEEDVASENGEEEVSLSSDCCMVCGGPIRRVDDDLGGECWSCYSEHCD